MADIDLWLIEKYVRAPESLDAETAKTIQAYLDESAFAAEAAAFYREFYETLDAQPEAPLSSSEKKPTAFNNRPPNNIKRKRKK